MKSLPIVLTFAVAALSACVAPAPTVSTRLSNNPTLSGGTYTSGGGITIAAELRQIDGQLALCGAWAQSRRQSVMTKHVEHRLLQTGVALVNGQRVRGGLGFMNEVDPMADYSGAEANCVSTGQLWQAAHSSAPVRIEIPRQVVFRDDTDVFGGGFYVLYRHTGPGAGQ